VGGGVVEGGALEDVGSSVEGGALEDVGSGTGVGSAVAPPGAGEDVGVCTGAGWAPNVRSDVNGKAEASAHAVTGQLAPNAKHTRGIRPRELAIRMTRS
jgi:hypothetical protein